MVNAGVLNVLVTASTGKANAALRTTQGQFRATAATAQSSASTTQASWKKAVGVMAVAGAAAGAVSAKLAIDFDRGMRNVNSIAQLSERQLQSLSGEVLKLAGPTAQAPQTLAEGMYDLVSSGFDAKESLTIVKESAIAATAGLTDAATSTKVTAAVLNAYRLPATEAKNVTDVLFRTVDRGVISFEELAGSIGDTLPFASQLGVELYEVGAAASTMTKQGLGPPETMTRIRNVMQTLIKPSSDLKKAFKELGMSGEEMIERFGFQGTLERLVATTDGTKEAVAELFPNIRALGGVLALTGDNAKAASKDLRGLKDAGGATAKALEQQSKSISYQWQQLKAESSALAIEWGNKLLPGFVTAIKVLRGLTVAATDVLEWVLELPRPILIAAGAMTTLTLAASGVRALLATGLVQSLVSTVGTLRILGMEFAAVTRTMGLAQGALSALRLAFATNPFGMAVAGVGLLAGAVAGLADAFDGLFSKEKSIPPLQQRIQRTSERLKKVMEAERTSLENLSESSRKVRGLRNREKDASDRVKEASRQLNRVRNDSKASIDDEAEAQVKLVLARRREHRINKRLKEAQREQGAARKAAKIIIQDAYIAARKNVKALRRENRELLQNRRFLLRTGASADKLKENEKNLAANTKNLRRARRDLGQTLEDAANRVGPKFAKRLRDMSDLEVRFGREIKTTVRTLKNPYENTLFDAMEATSDLGKETRKLGGNYRNTRKTASGAIRDIGTQTNTILGDLGVKDSMLSIGKRNKKRTGGFVVDGHGYGDKVPVNLLLEPGETGFILNKHASRELANLNALNREFPRYQMRVGGMVDPAGPGTGVVNKAIAGVVGRWSQKYNAAINYGYDPGGGHRSPGHNVTGTATDTSPAAGWAVGTPLFERGLRAIEGKVDQILYGTAGIGTPYPNHGRGNHAHIEWGMHPEVQGALAASIRKVPIVGPHSTFKVIAEAVERKVRQAATRYVQRQMAKLGGADMHSMGGTGWSKSQLMALWRRVHRGFGDPNTMAAIALAESNGNPRAVGHDSGGTRGLGLWQITTGYNSDIIKRYGGESAMFNPVKNAMAAGDILRRQGLSAWNPSRHNWVQFLARGGGINTGRAGLRNLRSMRKKAERIEELIDVTTRKAGFPRSPAGAELSLEERASLINLNERLLSNLIKQRRTAQRVLKRINRAMPEKVKGKTISQLEKDIERKRRELSNLPPKADQRRRNLRRSLEKMRKELGRFRRQDRTRETLTNRRSSVREILEEVQGLTGKGGRIFDTKEALQELKNQTPGLGGAGGLNIEQLLSFAEALNYGAFRRGLPSYARGTLSHPGGWALVGEDGPELARMPGGTRVYSTGDSQQMLQPKVVVKNYFAPGTEWLADFVDTRIEIEGKEVEGVWEAGVAS